MLPPLRRDSKSFMDPGDLDDDFLIFAPTEPPEPVESARARFQERSKQCPSCQLAWAELAWTWRLSDPFTWRMLVGRAGWLITCPRCQTEVDYILITRS